MIEIKDLRTGNLILVSDLAHDWIVGTYTYAEPPYLRALVDDMGAYVQRMVTECAPVVLTEKWLTLLGFTKDGGAWIDESKTFVLYYLEGQYIWDMKAPAIEYVHQLQNVVYFTRGIELTVKS